MVKKPSFTTNCEKNYFSVLETLVEFIFFGKTLYSWKIVFRISKKTADVSEGEEGLFHSTEGLQISKHASHGEDIQRVTRAKHLS